MWAVRMAAVCLEARGAAAAHRAPAESVGKGGKGTSEQVASPTGSFANTGSWHCTSTAAGTAFPIRSSKLMTVLACPAASHMRNLLTAVLYISTIK